MGSDLTVACVLKSGGRYDTSWVHRLQRMVARFYSAPHRFVCLSDTEITGVEVIPLEDNLRGFWSKVELFRPGIFDGCVLYFDLDVVFTQLIEDLVQVSPFITIRDWQTKGINSSVMFWVADHPKPRRIYESFNTSVMGRLYGDQNWMDEVVKAEFYPESWIVSYKRSVRGKGLPSDAKVVVFHGEPKQDKVEDPWVKVRWN